jgi:hypothetical protein
VRFPFQVTCQKVWDGRVRNPFLSVNFSRTQLAIIILARYVALSISIGVLVVSRIDEGESIQDGYHSSATSPSTSASSY